MFSPGTDLIEPLRIFSGAPRQAEQNLADFLKWVGGPALFHLRGRDSNRCRVLCGGLHGNEPSGFFAIHSLLREPPEFPVDTILILGNVKAALQDPGFYYRMLSQEEDMNRIWTGGVHTPLRQAAAEVLRYLARRRVEAVVDLHNNSGFYPIYSVILNGAPSRIALARHWTHRYVRYDGASLGTFLEVLDRICPGVVIECGQAGDPSADLRALDGAVRFLTAERPFAPSREFQEDAAVYRCVARVTVPQEVSLEFGSTPTGSDLTIRPGIDRHNFELLKAGTRLAERARPAGRLVVTDAFGREVTKRFLEHSPRWIRLTQDIVPVMMTNDGRAAKSDCLLYVAERVDVAGAAEPFPRSSRPA
ncbi:MAG: succinylglutamate desuccinylase/aspartoacylase family protein [Planctomycetes bacterium]|nr:succinylglutamate desuccinylase/aspartoacylase family protein [Planctomycetota bacterium]